MSCVTVAEIIQITARVFCVPATALSAPAGRCSASWAYMARGAAVMLARRHTDRSLSAIVRAFGLSDVGQQRIGMGKLARRIEAQCKLYTPLAELIAECEDAIDRLHDSRVENDQLDIETAIRSTTHAVA